MRLDEQLKNKDSNTKKVFWARKYLYNVFFIVLFLTSSIFVVNWSNIRSGLSHQIAEAGFKLRVVEINGRNHITHEELINALGLQKNEPILSINLTKKRKKVEQLGWVERAFLERILPDTLRLSIIERKPVALLQTQKGHQIIDQNGQILLILSLQL